MSFNRNFFSDNFDQSSDFFRDLDDFRRARRPDMRFHENPFHSMNFGSGRPSTVNGYRDGRFNRTGLMGEIPIPVIHERNGDLSKEDLVKQNSEQHQHPFDEEKDNLSKNSSSSSMGGSENAANDRHESKVKPRIHHIPIKVESRDETILNQSPLSRSSSNSSQRSADSSGHSFPAESFASSFSKLSPSSSRHSNNSDEYVIPIKIEKGVDPIKKQANSRYTSSIPENLVKAKSASPRPGSSSSSLRRTPTPNKDYQHQQQSSGPYVTRINVKNEESQSNSNTEVSKKPLDPIELIENINKEISELEAQIQAFTGQHQDKQYRYLDEMLTRCMIKLDNIEVEGREDVRLARKAALATIHRCLNILDMKAGQTPNQSESTAEDQDCEQRQVDESSDELQQQESKDCQNSNGNEEEVNQMESEEKQNSDSNMDIANDGEGKTPEAKITEQFETSV